MFSTNYLICPISLVLPAELKQYAKLYNLTESEGISAPVPDFLFELEYCD